MMSTIKPVFPGDPPVAPGPTATPAEHRWFAEDNAYHSLLVQRWNGWIAAHPEDAEITAKHSFAVAPDATAPEPKPEAPTPPAPPQPRPDGTSARSSQSGRQTGATGL